MNNGALNRNIKNVYIYPFVIMPSSLNFLYTANIYRDYREFTGISCTLYRVFPVTGKNL